jgi:hypothetical protein
VKIPLDRAQLLGHLRSQIGYLRRSAELFDAGHDDEAARMATAVRVMVHDTNSSSSLLGQLGVLSTLAFVDTSVHQGTTRRVLPNGAMELRQTVSPGGMAAIELASDRRFRFVASCRDDGRRTAFVDWWAAVLVPATPTYSPEPKYSEVTRRSLVLTMANQDGGAHVDPGLDVHYAAFVAKRHGVPFDLAGSDPIEGSPARVSMRQIAFEVLLTLDESGVATA